MDRETRTIQEHAGDLLSYWEMHGESPETVAKWAVEDLLGILRRVAGAGE